MSIRNFDKLFRPRSVALIGASDRPSSVGAVVLRNLRRDGFRGELMLVNPHHQTLDGLTVYPAVSVLPAAPDMAVIVTPPATVSGLIAELAARGTKAAVVITAGFGELAEEGRALQQAALDAARPHLLRIVGPNCVGILVPPIGLDASFSHLAPPAGDIAFVSQSGDDHRDARLGRAARRRLFACRLARRYGRCRFRRHARSSRDRPRHARDPALC